MVSELSVALSVDSLNEFSDDCEIEVCKTAAKNGGHNSIFRYLGETSVGRHLSAANKQEGDSTCPQNVAGFSTNNTASLVRDFHIPELADSTSDNQASENADHIQELAPIRKQSLKSKIPVYVGKRIDLISNCDLGQFAKRISSIPQHNHASLVDSRPQTRQNLTHNKKGESKNFIEMNKCGNGYKETSYHSIYVEKFKHSKKETNTADNKEHGKSNQEQDESRTSCLQSDYTQTACGEIISRETSPQLPKISTTECSRHVRTHSLDVVSSEETALCSDRQLADEIHLQNVDDIQLMCGVTPAPLNNNIPERETQAFPDECKLSDMMHDKDSGSCSSDTGAREQGINYKATTFDSICSGSIDSRTSAITAPARSRSPEEASFQNQISNSGCSESPFCENIDALNSQYERTSCDSGRGDSSHSNHGTAEGATKRSRSKSTVGDRTVDLPSKTYQIMGKLGPDPEVIRQRNEKMQRQREYGSEITERNKKSLQTNCSKSKYLNELQKSKQPNLQQIMKQYAQSVPKPKMNFRVNSSFSSSVSTPVSARITSSSSFSSTDNTEVSPLERIKRLLRSQQLTSNESGEEDGVMGHNHVSLMEKYFQHLNARESVTSCVRRNADHNAVQLMLEPSQQLSNVSHSGGKLAGTRAVTRKLSRSRTSAGEHSLIGCGEQQSDLLNGLRSKAGTRAKRPTIKRSADLEISLRRIKSLTSQLLTKSFEPQPSVDKNNTDKHETALNQCSIVADRSARGQHLLDADISADSLDI